MNTRYMVNYDGVNDLAPSLKVALKMAQIAANKRLGGFKGVSIYAYDWPGARTRLVWRDGYPC